MKAAYKESDDAGKVVFGETDDKEEIAESVPCHGDHEAGTSVAPPAARKSNAR